MLYVYNKSRGESETSLSAPLFIYTRAFFAVIPQNKLILYQIEMCLEDTRCPQFSTYFPTSLPRILSELHVCHKQNSQTDGQMSVQRVMPTRGHLLGYFFLSFCTQQVRSNTQEANRINKFTVTYSCNQ